MGRIITFAAAVAFLVTSIAAPSFAEPADPSRYNVATGLVQIPFGSHVEGSVRTGGTQPDYVIHRNHPGLRKLLRYAREVGKAKAEKWEQVGSIMEYLNREVLIGHAYDNPAYRALNEEYVGAGKPVPLGKYAECHAGVCRESAMMLHLALREAGIESNYAYAKVAHGTGELKIEDHAFLVVPDRGEYWVVDGYFKWFNGFRLRDLMRGIWPGDPNVFGKKAVALRTSASGRPETFVKVMEIREFPRVWIPKLAGTPRKLEIDFVALSRADRCGNYYRALSQYPQ